MVAFLPLTRLASLATFSRGGRGFSSTRHALLPLFPAVKDVADAQEDQFGVVIGSALDFLESRRARKLRRHGLLDDDQRIGREPVALARRGERFFRMALCIRRIEEDKREGLERMGSAESRRIAAEYPRLSAGAKRFDIGAKQGARLGAVIDKQNERRTARQGFETERAGAGKKIEHTRVRDRIAIAMRQDVEQGLAQPIRAGADRARFRRLQTAPTKAPADNAHQSQLPWVGITGAS